MHDEVGIATNRRSEVRVLREGQAEMTNVRRLIDGLPGRQSIGQQAPRTTGPDQLADRVEEPARSRLPLRRILLQQRQVRRAKRPFYIADSACRSGLLREPLI